MSVKGLADTCHVLLLLLLPSQESDMLIQVVCALGLGGDPILICNLQRANFSCILPLILSACAQIFADLLNGSASPGEEGGGRGATWGSRGVMGWGVSLLAAGHLAPGLGCRGSLRVSVWPASCLWRCANGCHSHVARGRASPTGRA